MRYEFEDREIQPLLPGCTIESFHVRILCGLARLDKLQFDPMIVNPLPEFLTDMLGSVIHSLVLRPPFIKTHIAHTVLTAKLRYRNSVLSPFKNLQYLTFESSISDFPYNVASS